MKKVLLTIVLFSAIAFSANAQLTLQNGLTPVQLGTTLAGSNMAVTNATVSGAALQSGTFHYTGTDFPLSDGVILSTGSIFDAVGPNNNGGLGTDMGQPGNALLTAIAGVPTQDAVEFKFDFTVQSSQVEFQYIFASEEYNEFVGSNFNDVFAFFISGPGIVGEQNIALIPNTTVPVAINNVNNGSYWQYFHDNTTNNTNIQYDGYTTVLRAIKTGLIPCQTYTLKLIIADAGDGIFDAAVFLKANSLIQGNVSASTSTYSANNIALEGCVNASFTFTLDSALSVDTHIPYSIGGSAINGVDYAHIDSLLVIPAGQLSATIIIDATSDGLAEGQESIELYFTPAPCQPKDTVKLFVNDYQNLQFQTIPSNAGCFQSCTGQINFNISGGTAPYSIILTDSATNVSTTYTSYPITGLCAGTYHIKILDAYGCFAEDQVSGGLFDADTTFLPDGTGVSYSSSLVISGFPAGQTLTDVNQIVSICANMEHSYANDLDIKLRAPNNALVMLKNVGPTGGAINANNFGEPVASGTVDNWATNVVPGVGYDYCWSNTPMYATMNAVVTSGILPTYTYVSTFGNTLTDYYLPPGSYASVQPLAGFIGTPLNGTWTLIVTDHYAKDNGYIFNWSISLAADLPDSVVTITQPNQPTVNAALTNPSCGASTGAVNITVTGGFTPYTFHWSNGSTTEDITGVGAGNYTVSVTDAHSCVYTYTFNLPNSSSATLAAVATPQLCYGGSTGSIDLTISGGTSPYTVLWSNSAITEDISGLAPGNYSVQVTDGAGCISAASYTVQPATQIVLNSTVTNEECGNGEGIIDITVQGGTSPYTYLWSNAATTQDVTDLSQGSYSVTVTDNKGCTKTTSFNVINLVGNCIPTCDLAVQSSVNTPENCGNGLGSIQQTIFTSSLPVSYLWSNGATTKDISGLHAGTYTCTLTDAAPCEVIQTYVVLNQTGTLAINSQAITHETCGNGNGSINITPTGGVLPYSFIWSNSATTEDLTALHAGTYSVTITDGNGCSLQKTYTVTNDAGTLAQTYGNAMNATCGQSNGSIDIQISGGSFPYTYLWSNAATTEDLLNIPSGNYSCTITDNSGCSLITPVYSVLNESGTLAFTNIDVDNETCSNGSGKITLTIAGGALPLTYLWSTGAVTQNITALHAGNYSCTVTDNNGCSINTGTLVLINDPGTLLVSDVFIVDEVCTNTMGSVTLSVDGGTLPYTFHWDNGSTSQNIYNLHAGSYTCQITDAAGCTVPVIANVQNSAGSLQIDNMVVTNETCGNGVGAINLIISGATAPITYAWSSGQAVQDITALHSGTYTVTVHDNNGCIITGNAQVNNITSNGFSAEISGITNAICGNNNGSVNVTASGGNTPYTYIWSNSATTEDLINVATGSYSCTVTDQTGCKVLLGPALIGNTSGTMNQTAFITDALCTSANGEINMTVTGGTSPYTFLWSNAATTEDLSNLTAANYTVTITDNTGCTLVHTYTVSTSSGTLALANVAVADETCNNNSGSVTLTVSGGATPYTYLWSNAAITQNISGLNQGNYSATVTDANGCKVYTGTLHVSDNPGNFNLVSIISNNENCGDGTGNINITLSGGTVPLSYTWSTGLHTQDLNNLHAGVYSCTTTDNNGCSLSYSSSVSNNPGNIQLSATENIASCGLSNGMIDLTVNGGTLPLAYLWSNNATTQDLSGISGGNYTVMVTDAAGCHISETYAISSTPAVAITSSVITDEICGNSNGSITITASGTEPLTYTWSTGTSIPCCNYTLHLYRTNGGMGSGWNGASVDAIVDGVLSNHTLATGENSLNINLPVCSGDSIKLIYHAASNDFRNIYELLDADGVSIYSSGANPNDLLTYAMASDCPAIVENSNSLNNLQAGNYSVIVTDANNCSDTMNFVINNALGTLAVSGAVVTDDYCGTSTGSIDISVAGGTIPYHYTWSNAATTEDISNIAAGSYTVTVYDNIGCERTQTYTIINLAASYAIGTTLIDTTYCGDSTGAVNISVGGGTAPYTYLWSNGAITEDISNVPSATYTVTVYDTHLCPLTQSYFVPNKTNGLAVTDSIVGEICTNSGGAVFVEASGGVGPYTYLWSNSADTTFISGISAGIYAVTITDASGCRQFGNYVVPLDSGNLAIPAGFVNNEYCGMSNGNISPFQTGGTTPYTYLWNTVPPQATLMASNLSAGIYSITIIDANGCQATESFTVLSTPSLFDIDTVVTQATCMTCPDGSIMLTPVFSGSTTTLYYNWSTGATSQNLINILPGSYTVTVSDSAGCSYTQIFTVGGIDFIGEADNMMNVQLFPNPANGMFYVTWRLNSQSDLEIFVYNPIGELVYSNRNDNTLSGKIQIDLSGAGQGVYLVKVKAGKDVLLKRLVIMR
ncbi:MAG: choice-of-anchor L domain-containing protein [Bacteroidota bacterium]